MCIQFALKAERQAAQATNPLAPTNGFAEFARNRESNAQTALTAAFFPSLTKSFGGIFRALTTLVAPL